MLQVWLNLLTNAIKFSVHQDSPCIEIGSKGEQNEKIFFIQDNGVGFDMQHVGKIFDVFQRLHSSRDFEGNGVGLAIVQRIDERRWGQVWAQGQVNQGATFLFTLSARETHSESENSKEKERRIMSRPLHILFLEDSVYDLKLMERELIYDGLVYLARRVETRADFLQQHGVLARFDSGGLSPSSI